MTRFRRTLIVEQSNEYVNQVRDILQDVSDSFYGTTSGEEAFELYDRYHPDLVLVEAILPGYDGFALMEHMLADKDVVKLVLTSLSQELIIKKAFELEANYIFVKPYVKKIFVDRLLDAADLHTYNRSLSLLDGDQLLSARISVCLLYTSEYYSQHLDEIVAVWNGGIAIYGALIGGIIAAVIIAKWRKFPLGRLLDICLLYTSIHFPVHGVP